MAREMAPEIAAACMVALAVPAAFAYFCPPHYQAGDTPADRVRAGEVKAAAAALLLGLAVAAATRSPWPALAAATVAGATVWHYEQIPRPEETP